MKTAVISHSPEEMSEHFFKTLARFGILHKATAWSRKDRFPTTRDIFFLSQRDYIHLKKNENLPHPHHICLLMTEDYESVALNDDIQWKSSFLISGNERGRGELAAYLYAYLNHHSFDHEYSDSSSNPLASLGTKLPWLQTKMNEIIEEIENLNGKHKSRMAIDHSKIVIDAEIPLKCPDWAGFSETLLPLNLSDGASNAPGTLVFKKIARDATITLASPLNEVSTKLHIVLDILGTQKAYEKRHRLCGVLSNGNK